MSSEDLDAEERLVYWQRLLQQIVRAEWRAKMAMKEAEEVQERAKTAHERAVKTIRVITEVQRESLKAYMQSANQPTLDITLSILHARDLL